jgi:hypothetical protein
MVTQLSQTKDAIYQREMRAKAKAAKGPTPPKPLIPPPQDAGGGEAPANLWKQHQSHPAYYGRPDGKV